MASLPCVVSFWKGAQNFDLINDLIRTQLVIKDSLVPLERKFNADHFSLLDQPPKMRSSKVTAILSLAKTIGFI